LLLEALASTNVAGKPNEYFDIYDFNEQFRISTLGICGNAEFLDRVVAATSTANGVFGVKLLWHQLPSIIAKLNASLNVQGSLGTRQSLHALLSEKIGDPRYIWLLRENKLAQAITPCPRLTPHLRRLKAEAIEILREVAAEFGRSVMLYSIGKDSGVMLHLASKAFLPAPLPLPLLHVDTTWKFRQMIALRDLMAAALGFELLVHVNREGLARGINPIASGSVLYTHMLKTEAAAPRPMRQIWPTASLHAVKHPGPAAQLRVSGDRILGRARDGDRRSDHSAHSRYDSDRGNQNREPTGDRLSVFPSGKDRIRGASREVS